VQVSTSEAMALHLRDMFLLKASVIDSMNQLSTYRRCCANACHADYETSVVMMERLLQDFDAKIGGLQRDLKAHDRAQRMEAADITIKESRSAIAGKVFMSPTLARTLTIMLLVTVLTFVFIPMNLAFSIYGMNVQEINSTGHRIWTFVVTAIGLLIASGLMWVWRHTMRRIADAFWGTAKDLTWLSKSCIRIIVVLVVGIFRRKPSDESAA
jgi:Mg2+ and Co2+ transporter CorA